jgi:hypothetical protein
MAFLRLTALAAWIEVGATLLTRVVALLAYRRRPVFGLRRGRYHGLAETHLRHVATAAAIDLERLAAWFRAVPRAATRTSRFAALAA